MSNDSGKRQSLTFCIMDGPFEQARIATVFRMIDVAVGRGMDVKVFAYEGAVSLAFALQAKHPNKVHGRDAVEEDHFQKVQECIEACDLARFTPSSPSSRGQLLEKTRTTIREIEGVLS